MAMQFSTAGFNRPHKLRYLAWLIALIAMPAAAQNTVVRVSAAPTAVRDSANQVWRADSGFAGGWTWRTPAGIDIRGTSDDAIYQHEHAGMRSWSQAVPNGDYVVTLKMRESWFSAPGKRVFSVAAEGVPVITDLDIFRTVGQHTALDRSFPVRVTDNRLDLAFSAKADVAAITAIQALPAPVDEAQRLANLVGTVSPIPLRDWLRDVEYSGSPVGFVNGLVTAGAKASSARWRSEIIWSNTAGGSGLENCMTFREGERVVAEFSVKADLGALPDGTSSVIYQLLGETSNATVRWPGPPVTLVIRRGQFEINGGYAVPDGKGGVTSQHGYSLKTAKTAVDGGWHRVLISTLLGGPGKGTIDAWIDGTRVVSGFRPGAGTYYTVPNGYAHRYVYAKNGLYGGHAAAPYSPWAQTIQFKNIRLTRHRAAQAVSHYSPRLP